MARDVDATALIRADNRRLRGDLRRSDRMFNRTFSKVGRSIKSKLSGALSPLGIGLGVAGLAALGKQVIDFEEGLVRLGIQAKQSDDWIEGMRQSILAMSRQTGIAREKILGAAKGIVDLEGAAGFSEEKLRALLDVHIATGTEMQHLAGIAFALNTSFFKGAASAEDLKSALGAITVAGKEGSIPMEQMATILRQVAPIFARTGATGRKAAGDLAALLQVGARGAFGSPEEVATGLRSFVDALAKARGRLRKFNVDPFEKLADGSTRLKDVRTIINEIANSKLAKRPDLLQKVFGRGEAVKFVEVMLRQNAAFEELASSADHAGDVIDKDMGRILTSTAGRMRRATNNAREAFLKAFTPERIEMFADAMERVAKAIEWIVDHGPELIAIWGAFKLASLASAAATLASNLGIAGSAATKLSGQLGGALGIMDKLGKASLVVGAGLAGWEFGSWLDRKFGLSDKISDHLVGAAPKRAATLGGLDFSLQDTARGLLGDNQVGRGAGRALLVAREQGFLNEAGTGAASREQIANRLIESGLTEPGIETGLEADRILRTIERAFAARAAHENRVQQVEVRISVDQRGMIVADQVRDRQSRRGPQ